MCKPAAFPSSARGNHRRQQCESGKRIVRTTEPSGVANRLRPRSGRCRTIATSTRRQRDWQRQRQNRLRAIAALTGTRRRARRHALASVTKISSGVRRSCALAARDTCRDAGRIVAWRRRTCAIRSKCGGAATAGLTLASATGRLTLWADRWTGADAAGDVRRHTGRGRILFRQPDAGARLDARPTNDPGALLPGATSIGPPGTVNPGVVPGRLRRASRWRRRCLSVPGEGAF